MPIIALSALTLLGQGLDLQSILIIVMVLTISLSFHEFMHGYVAYRLGDDTAYLAGRLTMNPLAHLDPLGALLFVMVGFGYAKPVPINPTRFTRSRSMKTGIMLTSLAGPAANFVLAIAAVILYYSTATVALLMHLPQTNGLYTLLSGLFRFLYQSNIYLMVFNLLPVPPLDGSKIFSVLLPNELYYRFLNLQRYSGIILLVIFLFARNALGNFLDVIRVPFDYIILTPLESVFRALWRLIGIG